MPPKNELWRGQLTAQPRLPHAHHVYHCIAVDDGPAGQQRITGGRPTCGRPAAWVVCLSFARRARGWCGGAGAGAGAMLLPLHVAHPSPTATPSGTGIAQLCRSHGMYLWLPAALTALPRLWREDAAVGGSSPSSSSSSRSRLIRLVQQRAGWARHGRLARLLPATCGFTVMTHARRQGCRGTRRSGRGTVHPNHSASSIAGSSTALHWHACMDAWLVLRICCY